jgi:hypothetical protein
MLASTDEYSDYTGTQGLADDKSNAQAGDGDLPPIPVDQVKDLAPVFVTAVPDLVPNHIDPLPVGDAGQTVNDLLNQDFPFITYGQKLVSGFYDGLESIPDRMQSLAQGLKDSLTFDSPEDVALTYLKRSDQVSDQYTKFMTSNPGTLVDQSFQAAQQQADHFKSYLANTPGTQISYDFGYFAGSHVPDAALFMATEGAGEFAELGDEANVLKEYQPLPSTIAPDATLIGNSGYRSIGEFTDAVTAKYQSLYDQGYSIASQNATQGLISNTARAIGSDADAFARVGLRDWLTNVEGIQEGPGEIIQVNRRLYDPSGSGAYRIPDVYIPGSQTILDGSISFKTGATPQVVDFGKFSGGAKTTIIAPSGLPWSSYSIP